MSETLTFPPQKSITSIVQNLKEFRNNSKKIEDYLRLGHFYLIRGMYPEAEHLFSALLDLFPKNWKNLYGLGLALLNQNKIRRARTYFTILLEEYPEKCEIEELVHEINQDEPYFTEDHRYFITYQ